jgi:hypothetical protein
MDLYRELVSIYAISFIISLYLIFLIGVQISDATGLNFTPKDPNGPTCIVWFDSALIFTARLPDKMQMQHCLQMTPFKSECLVKKQYGYIKIYMTYLLHDRLGRNT